MGTQQRVDLVVGDDRAPELSLGAHGRTGALSPHGPQEQEVCATEPFASSSKMVATV